MASCFIKYFKRTFNIPNFSENRSDQSVGSLDGRSVKKQSKEKLNLTDRQKFMLVMGIVGILVGLVFTISSLTGNMGPLSFSVKSTGFQGITAGILSGAIGIYLIYSAIKPENDD